MFNSGSKSTKRYTWMAKLIKLSVGKFLTFVVKNYRIVSIVGLLNRCSPFAILCSVITIIINSLYRMIFRRPWSHIFDKLFKTSTPRMTNFNTSSAISWVVCSFYVVTSPSQHSPNIEFWGAGHPVCSRPTNRRFNSKTSTGSRDLIYKYIAVSSFCIPATA